MRIVFLNLADRHDQGLAQTSAKALKKKYTPRDAVTTFLMGPNSVELYDIFDLFEACKAGTLDSRNPKLQELRKVCRAADKIMLAAHGNYGDTVQVSASPGWDKGEAQVIGTYKELAAMMREILIPDCSYRLSLIICYAARSSSVLKDHSDPSRLSNIEIRSSFAFKFFSEICTYCRVQMTARIGAVEFDGNTGASLVRTEAATSAQVEYDEMQRVDEITETQGAFEKLRDQYVREGKIEAFSDMEEKFVDGHLRFKANVVAVGPEESIIQNYHRVNSKAQALVSTAATGERKFGKLIYRYLLGRLAVFAKYPTERIIYAGPV